MRTGWLFLISFVVAGCGGGDKEKESGQLRLDATRVPVEMAPVVRDTISDQIVLVGRLVPTPGAAATLAAPAAGVVKSVRVQIGAEVRAGDLLIELDVPELASQVTSQQASAEAAAREAARLESLYQDGIASRKALDEAKAAAVSAQSAFESARALMARTRVRSPIEGGIQSVSVQPGERVDAGAALVTIVDADTVDLIASVPANAIVRLRRHQPATVTTEDGETPRPGWVEGLSPTVDSISGAGNVVVRVPNPGEALRPGSGGTAVVTLGVIRAALIVPNSAIILQGDSTAVFVLRPDSIVSARRVAIGVRHGGRVQVTAGVSEGDRVVTTGAFGLEDGMRVVPRRASTP